MSDEPKIITDRKTYSVTRIYPCCATCKHSYVRMGISLLCNNRDERVKESCVEPLGICDSYEKQEQEK